MLIAFTCYSKMRNKNKQAWIISFICYILALEKKTQSLRTTKLTIKFFSKILYLGNKLQNKHTKKYKTVSSK